MNRILSVSAVVLASVALMSFGGTAFAATTTLDFSGEVAASSPTCYGGSLGGSISMYQSGFHFSDNSYSAGRPSLEISPDGGEDYSRIVHETCGAFSVLSLEAYYYNLFEDDPDGPNFRMTGYLGESVVASLYLTLPSFPGSLVDLGSIFSNVDVLEVALVNPRKGICDRPFDYCYNGVLIPSMTLSELTPVPLPASLPLLFAGLASLGFWGRRTRLNFTQKS